MAPGTRDRADLFSADLAGADVDQRPAAVGHSLPALAGELRRARRGHAMAPRRSSTAWSSGLIVALVCMVVATAVGRAIPQLRRPGGVVLIALLPLFVPGMTMGAALFIFLRSFLGLKLGFWSIFIGHIVWALPFSLLTRAGARDPLRPSPARGGRGSRRLGMAALLGHRVPASCGRGSSAPACSASCSPSTRCCARSSCAAPKRRCRSGTG